MDVQMRKIMPIGTRKQSEIQKITAIRKQVVSDESFVEVFARKVSGIINANLQ